MKKTQKTLLYLCLPVLVAIISIPFWLERYGDSYNEQQRKLWNEEKALWERGEFVGSYTSPPPHIEEQIERKRKLSESLWASSAPDREITLPSTPDLSKLPLGGMTLNELLHYAEHNKNPDAWLLLISSCSDDHFHWAPTKLQLLLMKKYAAKAHQLNRPGSDFLLKAIDKREETLTTEWREVNALQHLETIAGYKEFKELVGSGDFTLYKTLVAIWPDLEQTSMGSNLESVLEGKALQGDIIAQRQLGEYGFLCRYVIRDVIRKEKERPRSRLMVWLAEQIEKRHIGWITISKETNTSPTRDKLDEYAAWLKKAAEAGDLVAMQLWLDHGVEVMNQASRKDWEDILLYNDTMLKAGYANGLLRPYEIIRLSYSPDNMNRLQVNLDKILFERGSKEMTRTKLWKHNWKSHSKEENLTLLDKVELLVPEALISYNDGYNYLYHIRQIKDEDVKQRYTDIIRKIANEGEPYFMMPLADMIRKNLVKSNDPEEATRLLEKTWRFCPKYNEIFSHDNGKRYSNSHFATLSDLVVDHLMTIYLLEHPTPENRQKAFDLAGQYLLFNDSLSHAYAGKIAISSLPWNRVFNSLSHAYAGKIAAHFFMSLMYQKGYGTARDPEQEQYHYQQFFDAMKRYPQLSEELIKPLIKQFDYQMPE